VSQRAVVATTVLGAWVAGLALLFARELNPSQAARLADVSLRIVPITTFYMVEDSGAHIGFASIAIDTVPHSLQITEYLLTEPEGGSRHSDQLMVRLSRGLALKEFESTQARGQDTSRITGRVVDSTLILATTRGEPPATIPVALPAFAGVIGATVSILLDQPRVGATSSVRTIDPVTGRTAAHAMRIVAESLFVVTDSAVADSSGRWFAVHRDTVRAWRVVANAAPAFDAWVDAQGLVVESRLPNGLRLKRTAFELAFENWRLAHPDRAVSVTSDGSVVSGTWLASGVPRPSETLDTLRVRFGASTPREFASRYGRALRAGGQVTFARTPVIRLQSRYALPTSEAWQKVFTRELAPGPSIESDEPSIARRAARIAGDDRDPAAVARRIVAWVHDSIRAEGGAAPLGAAGALARRSGDAREFALLTTAFARAAGVPAHPVAGLLQHEGRFYLHAWAEVYVGRWVPVDAMLNQFPADASHLSFLTGTADPSPDLARVLTRLQLRVIGAVRADLPPPASPLPPRP
jgi:transglutaminase-like putative cysteine protease